MQQQTSLIGLFLSSSAPGAFFAARSGAKLGEGKATAR